jgi:hypothetical protein
MIGPDRSSALRRLIPDRRGVCGVDRDVDVAASKARAGEDVVNDLAASVVDAAERRVG